MFTFTPIELRLLASPRRSTVRLKLVIYSVRSTYLLDSGHTPKQTVHFFFHRQIRNISTQSVLERICIDHSLSAYQSQILIRLERNK